MKNLKSRCCNSKIDVEESGVSQMSYDEKYTCTKCKKELDIRRVFENKNMYFKEF